MINFIVPLFKWINLQGYSQGVFWIILVSLTSNINDILIRVIGDRLPSIEISFFRFSGFQFHHSN